MSTSRLASLVLAASVAIMACAPAAAPLRSPSPPSARGAVRAGTPDGVNIVKARELGREQLFSWSAWEPQSFARAKAEKRFILIHGAAEWCHWCHVMEETTYRDPEVGKILRDRFVAIRVDVDSRPDIEERYDEWGWPATIILDADAMELAKYRGYLQPHDMVEILAKLDATVPTGLPVSNPLEAPPPVSGLAWIGSYFAQRMDSYYDEREGGWGMRQKAPIGDNVSFELRRYERAGDAAALARARFSLSKHASLIDPVWGGIYQYSTGSDWTSPHFEKLMTYQAENLSAFAQAYRITGDQRQLEHARAIERYINTFLSNDEGAYLVSQDADVGAHDRDAQFVDGAVYYTLADETRRARGIPRVDANVYAEENGLAIAALADLYEATHDPNVLTRMTTAADRIASTHVDEVGRVKHDATGQRKVWHLADAAAFGFGLARLAEVQGGSERHLAMALRIARHIEENLLDRVELGGDGAAWAHTDDPDAAGVFKARRKPLLANVRTARFLALLQRLSGDERYLTLAREMLAGVAKPTPLRDRGRMIGLFLVALDDVGALRWH